MTAPPRRKTRIVIDQQLAGLRTLLSHLPADLPEPPVSSYDFSPLTGEEVKEYGSESSALVKRMEKQLGHLNPESQYHVEFRERGVGLLEVVGFLERYVEKNPTDVLIQGWIDGLFDIAKGESEVELDDDADDGIKVFSLTLI